MTKEESEREGITYLMPQEHANRTSLMRAAKRMNNTSNACAYFIFMRDSELQTNSSVNFRVCIKYEKYFFINHSMF